MLKPVSVADVAATNRLIKLWTARYLPNLSILPQGDRFPAAELISTASSEGRAKTVATASRFLQISCELAGLETNHFYNYLPNIIHLSEIRRMAQSVRSVYDKLLHIYVQQPTPNYFLKFIDSSRELFVKLAMPFLVLPAITQLAEDLTPVLLQFQAEHLNVRDPRAIGFLTTQFHFSNREILKQLSPYEQVLLTPYLKFIEEQVCIPWQRVCAVAAKYLTNSPTFTVVETLLPLCSDISEAVHRQAVQRYPNYHSRRGKLINPEVASSTIRDLTMFQGYLILSLLEDDMTVVEQELLPLCLMVFPSIRVQWELAQQVLALLMNDILSRVKPRQRELLLPYTQSFQLLFANATPLK